MMIKILPTGILLSIALVLIPRPIYASPITYTRSLINEHKISISPKLFMYKISDVLGIINGPHKDAIKPLPRSNARWHLGYIGNKTTFDDCQRVDRFLFRECLEYNASVDTSIELYIKKVDTNKAARCGEYATSLPENKLIYPAFRDCLKEASDR